LLGTSITLVWWASTNYKIMPREKTAFGLVRRLGFLGGTVALLIQGAILRGTGSEGKVSTYLRGCLKMGASIADDGSHQRKRKNPHYRRPPQGRNTTRREHYELERYRPIKRVMVNAAASVPPAENPGPLSSPLQKTRGRGKE